MSEVNQEKRQFFRQICCGGAALGAAAYFGNTYAATGKKTDLTPQQALAVLKKGNAEFVAGGPSRPLLGKERRLEIARGQTPIAVLVSCSDSRVPPELLFGRGLGELFIIRNAGNTVDTVAEGSLEYAVAELGVPLVVVMGHERCGAVEAALSVVENQTTFPGSIGQMIEPIIPAVLKAKSGLGKGKAPTHDALLDAAVRENITRVVTRLRESQALLLEPLRTKKLMIVGARYDLDDGHVDFYDT
jgi:carbonic anhydrase